MYCIVWIVCIVIFVGFGFGIIQSWCGFSSFRTQGSQSPRGSTLVIGLAVSAMTTSTSSTFSSGFRIQILDVFLRYRCSLLCNKIMKKLQELFSWKNSWKIFQEKFTKKSWTFCYNFSFVTFLGLSGLWLICRITYYDISLKNYREIWVESNCYFHVHL